MAGSLSQATLPVYGPGGGPWIVDGWLTVSAVTQDQACSRAKTRHGIEPWSAFPEDRTCLSCGAWGLHDHDSGCPHHTDTPQP